MDLEVLPLFSGDPAVEPLPSRKRRPERRNLLGQLVAAYVEPPAAEGSRSAVLLPFPPSRDIRLNAELAKAFVALRERHRRQCLIMLLDQRFRPIATCLRHIGLAPVAVETELGRLEKAVPRVVWIGDGRPAYSSGGSAA